MRLPRIAIAAALGLGLLLAAAQAAAPAPCLAADSEGPEQVPGQLRVPQQGSKLLRTKADIYRTQIDDPQVCDLVQVTPRELSVRGKKAGQTAVTVWLKDGQHKPWRLEVRVVAE